MSKIRLEIEVPDGVFCYDYVSHKNDRKIIANCPYLKILTGGGAGCLLFDLVVATIQTKRAAKPSQCLKAEIKEG